jgi:hypothetical protein
MAYLSIVANFIFILLSFIDDKHTIYLLRNNKKLSKKDNVNKLYLDNEIVAFFKFRMKLRGTLSDFALYENDMILINYKLVFTDSVASAE